MPSGTLPSPPQSSKATSRRDSMDLPGAGAGMNTARSARSGGGRASAMMQTGSFAGNGGLQALDEEGRCLILQVSFVWDFVCATAGGTLGQ